MTSVVSNDFDLSTSLNTVWIGRFGVSRDISPPVNSPNTRICRAEIYHTLGAKGNLPSGYVVSFLWVLKQFARLIPSG